MAAIPVPPLGAPTYQSWAKAVADTVNPLLALKWAALSGTTDPQGKFTIYDAAMGLGEIKGGIASLDFLAQAGPVTYEASSFHVVAGGAWTWIIGWNTVANDIAQLANTQCTVYVIAWGTPLP